MKALLFSRWGDFLHTLNVYSANQYCEINGEDYVDIETDEPLSKGDRILIYDGNKEWLEYVFDEGEQTHDGDQRYKITCENSFMWDTSLKYIRYTGWNSADCKYAVTELLKLHPAWTVEEVLSTPQKKLVYERETLYQAFLETLGAFNCEYKKIIRVNKTGVFERKIAVVEHIGERKPIRFDYPDTVHKVIKTINAEQVYTACYGFGSGIEDEELWCYVTNDDAVRYWGLSDGHGGVHHAEGEFTDNDIEDAATLKQATTDYLNAHSAPSITYETDIPLAAIEGAGLGDTVQVVDTEFYPELRLETRIGSMERDLLTNVVTKAVFGNVISYLPDALARSYSQSKIIIQQTTVIGELKGDLKEAQSALRSAQGSISSLTSDLGDTQWELSQTKSALQYAQRDLKTAQQDAAAAKKQANDLAVTVDSQQKTINQQGEDIKRLQSAVNEEIALLEKTAVGYQASILVGDAWLRAMRGQTLSQSDYNNTYSAYTRYLANRDTGGYRNEACEEMFNQYKWTYDNQHAGDEGGEEPSIGDESSEDPSAEPNTTTKDNPSEEA